MNQSRRNEYAICNTTSENIQHSQGFLLFFKIKSRHDVLEKAQRYNDLLSVPFYNHSSLPYLRDSSRERQILIFSNL